MMGPLRELCQDACEVALSLCCDVILEHLVRNSAPFFEMETCLGPSLLTLWRSLSRRCLNNKVIKQRVSNLSLVYFAPDDSFYTCDFYSSNSVISKRSNEAPFR